MGKIEVPKRSMPLDLLSRNKIGLWVPGPNTTVPSFGMLAPTFPSGAVTRTLATTNYFSQQRRVGTTGISSAGSPTSIYHAALVWYRQAGFRMTVRFGCSDAATVAGAQQLVALMNTTSALANVTPSAQINFIGIGHDAGDANLQIMHNDGSGTATKVDLGVNFPKNTLSVDAYELVLTCTPGASNALWEVTRLNTGHRATGTITTDLPSTTTLLTPHLYRTNGATALAVSIDLFSMSVEDY